MAKKKKNIWDFFLKELDTKLENNKLHDPIKKDKDFIINDSPKGKGAGFVISVKPTETKSVENKNTKRKVKKKLKIKKPKSFKSRFKLQGTGPKSGKQQRLNGGWFLPSPMRD